MLRSVYKTVLSLSLLTLVLLPQSALADTLSISPASGSYKVGQTFSVRIVTSSPVRAINAVSATLAFPTDKLQVTSISKIGSILNLWVEEPAFSNAQGTVSLEGVVPNPGFTGNSGPILTINFRVLEEGTANLRFSSGALLANDGYGTDILKNKGTASYTLLPRPIEVPVVEEAPAPEPEVIDLNQNKPAPKATEVKKVSFEMPSLNSIFNLLLKFLSILIPLFALFFLLLHTTKRGINNIGKLRKNVRNDLHNIDRLIEKSFDIIKEDISESIHILERARTRRKLTAEEDAIIHHLRQNLVDAEKIIHKEVLKAEKDIGD